MVIPVGESGSQELILITKSAEGRVDERSILPVAFVPLVKGNGRHGKRAR
jgi:protein-L-isoaspartate O-methyltransferase